MKKIVLALIASLALVSLTYAADSSIASGYYSTLHPQAGAAAKTMFPPTDIAVTNASSNSIYVVVPNSPINDLVYPRNSDHIRHSSYYGDTFISLQDPNHYQFWSGSVCRLAAITVYGYPGSYSVNVDRELCN